MLSELTRLQKYGVVMSSRLHTFGVTCLCLLFCECPTLFYKLCHQMLVDSDSLWLWEAFLWSCPSSSRWRPLSRGGRATAWPRRCWWRPTVPARTASAAASTKCPHASWLRHPRFEPRTKVISHETNILALKEKRLASLCTGKLFQFHKATVLCSTFEIRTTFSILKNCKTVNCNRWQ